MFPFAILFLRLNPACPSAMAIACLRDLTFGPSFEPLCNLPCLNSCMVLATLAFFTGVAFGLLLGLRRIVLTTVTFFLNSETRNRILVAALFAVAKWRGLAVNGRERAVELGFLFHLRFRPDDLCFHFRALSAKVASLRSAALEEFLAFLSFLTVGFPILAVKRPLWDFLMRIVMSPYSPRTAQA
jgi:hypothetical protein